MLSGNYSLGRLTKMILYPDSFFWFLWVLFWINVIFIFVRWAAGKINIDEIIPISITCVILLGLMVGLEIRILGFQFLAYYFLFYTLGYCVHRFEILQIKNPFLLFAGFVIWAVMAWSWNMHALPSWMPAIPHVPSSLLQYAYRGLTAMIAIIVILGVSPKILNTNGKFNLWMKEIGVVSLGIYVWHLIFLGRVIGVFNKTMPEMSDEMLIVLSSVVAFVLSIIVVELLKRNKITARLFLGKI